MTLYADDSKYLPALGGNVLVEPTKKITEAQFAYCETCDQWLGCQYWPLAKSVALHRSGTSHVIALFLLKS